MPTETMTRFEEAVKAELDRQTELYNAYAANGAPLAAPPDEDMIRATYSFLRETPLNMESSPAIDLARAIYRIGDGRFYSVERQVFLDAEPDGDLFIDLMDNGQPATVEYLRKTLEFYKLPVGDCLLDLEALRQRKLDELAEAFETKSRAAVTESSLGFWVDANERANRDLEGLITALEAGGPQTVQFCDAHNEFRALDIDGLKTLRLEVIAFGQRLYARKWKLRNAINAATVAETLIGIRIDL